MGGCAVRATLLRAAPLRAAPLRAAPLRAGLTWPAHGWSAPVYFHTSWKVFSTLMPRPRDFPAGLKILGGTVMSGVTVSARGPGEQGGEPGGPGTPCWGLKKVGGQVTDSYGSSRHAIRAGKDWPLGGCPMQACDLVTSTKIQWAHPCSKHTHRSGKDQSRHAWMRISHC